MDNTAASLHSRDIDLVRFSYSDIPYEINLEEIPSNNFPSWIVGTENRQRDTIACSGQEQTSTMETNCRFLHHSFRSNNTHMRSHSYDSATENSFEHVNRWAGANGIRSEVRHLRQYGWADNSYYGNFEEGEGREYLKCNIE